MELTANPDSVRLGDTRLITFTITRDGDALNLADTTVTLTIAKPNGERITAVVSRQSDGTFQYAPHSTMTLKGIYQLQALMTTNNVSLYTNIIHFTVSPNLTQP
jgi:hypothetical protein